MRAGNCGLKVCMIVRLAGQGARGGGDEGERGGKLWHTVYGAEEGVSRVPAIGSSDSSQLGLKRLRRCDNSTEFSISRLAGECEPGIVGRKFASY